jgi:RimJ/RimL family protein N-acetyltransferase
VAPVTPHHVTLRRASVADARLVHGWRAEEAARRYQPLRQLPLDELRLQLAERAHLPLGPTSIGKLQWIIEADGEPSGWLTLDIGSREHASAALGYTVSERFHGRGIGRRAVGALLPLAFASDGLNLERIEAVAAVTNVASRRVLERNGFRQEGILRGLLRIRDERVDHAIYGLLRTDWLIGQHGQRDRESG